MDIEHNFKTTGERDTIIKWFEREIGSEYDVIMEDDGNRGSIVFYELADFPDDMEKLFEFLRRMGYIDA